MDLAIVTSSLLILFEVAEGLKCENATDLTKFSTPRCGQSFNMRSRIHCDLTGKEDGMPCPVQNNIHKNCKPSRAIEPHDFFCRKSTYQNCNNDASALDGFAYKFSARRENEELENNNFFNMRRNQENATECDTVEESIWLGSEDYPCRLPCAGNISRDCGDLCAMLGAGYKTVAADVRELEFPVEFGVVYDLHVVPYSDWTLGFGALATGNEVIEYCKDAENDTHDCTNTTEFIITDRQIYSGPVSHFEKYDVTIDHAQNRAKVSFRWKRPYDYHPNATLEKYLIVKDETFPLPQELGGGDYDAITIENVKIGSNHTLRVVPVLHYRESPEYVLIVHGANFLEQYLVEDFDACSVDNGFGGRYCDEAANCTDLPPTANTSAICVCQPDLDGNGISTKWPEGSGCRDVDDTTYSY